MTPVSILTNNESRKIIDTKNKTNDESKKMNIKELFKDVMKTPVAEATVNIFLTPYLTLKIFLLIFVIASSGLASYLVIESIMDYYSFSVSTTSRTLFENPTLFPKVTFCNVNPFITEYAYNLTRMNITDGHSLSDEEKKKLGHDLKDILFECSFNNFPCYSNEFVWSFDETNGNCYTFNSGMDSNGKIIPLRKSRIDGPVFGLHLTLYVNVYDELFDQDELIMGTGAIFLIGNSTFQTDCSNGNILVSSGFQTNITVNRELKSILPKPYSNCEIDYDSPKFSSDSDLYNLIVQSNYAYTQQLCAIQCLQKYYINTFNCTYPYLLSLYNATVCNPELIVNIHNSDILGGNFLSEVCLPLCPLECDQILYKASISSHQLNGHSYIEKIKNNSNLAADFVNKNIDAFTAEKSIVRIKIFYDSLTFTHSTELPQMNIVSLLASIGGNLGLFLGMSVFSLCEIAEVAIAVFYIVRQRRSVRP